MLMDLKKVLFEIVDPKGVQRKAAKSDHTCVCVWYSQPLKPLHVHNFDSHHSSNYSSSLHDSVCATKTNYFMTQTYRRYTIY